MNKLRFLSIACCCLFFTFSQAASGDIIGFGYDGTGWTLNQGSGGAPPIITNDRLLITNERVSLNSAFYNERQDITRFTASFIWQNLTPFDGWNPGDGMVFTLQNQGVNAVGTGGGSSLGYDGISPATGVAFNLFQVIGTGYAPTSVPWGYMQTGPVDLHSLHPMKVTLTYDGNTLYQHIYDTIDQTSFMTQYTVDLVSDAGGSNAYVGFTGGTGSAYAEQWISDFRFTNLPEVNIDIKPGSFPNSINPSAKGVITVAVLTTEDFDALQVDTDSVRFGPAEAERTHKQAHVEDVDYDGDMDLVFHFRTQETGIQCGDTEATLTGETFDGRSFAGIDSIRTVNCKLTLTFTPVEWTIARDTHGAGIHTIFMIADVSPLVVDDLQDIGGELIWDETQITLCADPTYPPELQGKFISIRDVGDGFLRIGDGFQSNSQGPGCDINTTMQNAFDEFGLPNNACLSVRSGDINYEFCAPLNVIQ